MSQLKLYLLGPARIERNGQAVEVETRKASALLAYLALHRERLSRDQLATFFWPEYDQERAYANLRRTLWALNKALGEGWLTVDNLSLALRRRPGSGSMCWSFSRCWRSAAATLRRGRRQRPCVSGPNVSACRMEGCTSAVRSGRTGCSFSTSPN